MSLITKNVYRKIESELYSYPQKIKSIQERRDDIIYGRTLPDVMVSGGQVANLTASKGAKLAELSEGWEGLISEALQLLPMEQSKLIQLRYFDGYSPEIISDKLHISRSLYYAWRENLLYSLVLMATKKGLIDPFI